MTTWTILFDLLVTLGVALILGMIAERVGTSSLVGYLVAGLVVGPSALRLVSSIESVRQIAEIGVSMLLFTIGLEFSYSQLKRHGRVALLGGGVALMSLITIGGGLAFAFGVSWKGAIVLGSMLAMGSTAVVLRVLRERSELDTVHGRSAMGVLLFQDLAMVVLLLVVSFLAHEGRGSIWPEIGRTLLLISVFVVGLYVATNLLVPRLLNTRTITKNRELPIIVAICSVAGASYGAHWLGLSPAIGAFVAGLMLADFRWADQMRADVLPLRTLLVVVFFASIGMLVDLRWLSANLPLVIGVSLGIVVLKTIATYASVRPFGLNIVQAIACGLAVAQVGEFSFVLGNIARNGGLLSKDIFQLAVSTTLLTILATPFLVAGSIPFGRRLAKLVAPRRKLVGSIRGAGPKQRRGHIVIVGYGEAGEAAAATVREFGKSVVVIDTNHRNLENAEERGHQVLMGDAGQSEILEQANIDTAGCIVVTVPDHMISRIICSQVKLLAPRARVVARSRYHVHAAELDTSGADQVVDEEILVGEMLGQAAIADEGRPTLRHAELDPYHSAR